MSKITFWPALLAGVVVAALAVEPASAQKKYDAGASDTEIKIGQTMPYSGPASSYGTIGLAMAAYFEKVNAEGGVNGRKITLPRATTDSSRARPSKCPAGWSSRTKCCSWPARSARPPNIAVHKYLNGKVPQLFVATGATRGAIRPTSRGPWDCSPATRSRAHPRPLHPGSAHPAAKIGILYQNDDSGKDYSRALRPGLAIAKQIVAEISTSSATRPSTRRSWR